MCRAAGPVCQRTVPLESHTWAACFQLFHFSSPPRGIPEKGSGSPAERAGPGAEGHVAVAPVTGGISSFPSSALFQLTLDSNFPWCFMPVLLLPCPLHPPTEFTPEQSAEIVSKLKEEKNPRAFGKNPQSVITEEEGEILARFQPEL